MRLTFRPATAFEIIGRALVPRWRRPFEESTPGLDIVAALELGGHDRMQPFQIYRRRGPKWFVIAGHEGLRQAFGWLIKARPAGFLFQRRPYTWQVDLVGFDFVVSFGWCHTPNFELDVSPRFASR